MENVNCVSKRSEEYDDYNEELDYNNYIVFNDYLGLKSRYLKVWKQRWCVLTMDKELLIFKNKIMNDNYQNEIYNINLIKSNIIQNINDDELCFCISTNYNDYKYIFRTKNIQYKNKWIKYIKIILKSNLLFIKKGETRKRKHDLS